MEITEYLAKSVKEFKEKIDSWYYPTSHVKIFGELMGLHRIYDVKEMEEKLNDLSEIGEYIVVDIDTANFDRLSGAKTHKDKNMLDIIWYKENGSYFLRTLPIDMLVLYGDPIFNSIILRSEYAELRYDEELESIDIFKDIPIIIHPKGSIYNRDSAVMQLLYEASRKF